MRFFFGMMETLRSLLSVMISGGSVVARIQLLAFVSIASSVAADEFTVHNLFSTGAVLQRDAVVPVWGTAQAGSSVRIVFAGQDKTTIASEDGRWRIALDPLSASKEPLELVVTNGRETIAVSNVLVGEVWLCAGQSNMAMRVDLARDAEKEKADSDLPRLRVYSVDYQASREPQLEASGSWVVASPETAGSFSACAFFFGRELYRELDVPVGLVVAARGGSDIAAWTSHEAQENQPELSALLETWAERDAAYTPTVEAAEKATYEKELADWKVAIDDADEAGNPRPKKPRIPVNPRDHWHHPDVLYNGMIAPLVTYAIRGAIWYQGETNAFTEESSTLYETQLPLLVNDWRTRWNQGDFPFAWVQLPFTSANQVAWARIRESMRRSTVLPNTGMVVTLDLGEERLLHPLNKQAFAHRLALWARATVYGESIAWSGPLFTGHRVGEKGVLLRFQHDEGLAAQDGPAHDGPLIGFQFCTADGQWLPADVRIRDNRVVLNFSGTSRPTAVRYAWGNHPDGNLTNAAGLPASPFIVQLEDAGSSGGAATVADRPVVTTKKKKPAPTDLVKRPLEPVDVRMLPGSMKRLDIVLLMGQSNMKGRGVMPVSPLHDPQILMMHKSTDDYFLARHPLHLVGNPRDFVGADNAGVGPGLAFAQAVAATQRDTRILLVPCAVGGTQIASWRKGQRLYNETIRRAKLALEQGPIGKTRIAAALWLQGEADSNSPERISRYAANLSQLINDLRLDTGEKDLPFIACTIGEMRDDIDARRKINDILLDLPNHLPRTACVDSRSFAVSIGDNVHFDTATQQEHGRRFAAAYLGLTKE